jgi:hypothetical protein
MDNPKKNELKPKFDRFLKKYAFDGSMKDDFKIDNEKDALDYKIKIEPDCLQKVDISKRDGLFL